MKKILTLILVFCLSITFSGCVNIYLSGGNNEELNNPQPNPTPVVFSEGLSYELVGGKYKVVGVGTCVDADIIIPATFQNKPVVEIAENAFALTDAITSIKIPSSVTRIEPNAFYLCVGLERVVFEEKQGWMAKTIDTLPQGIVLELNDEVQVAQMLTGTYVAMYWVKV